MKNNTIPLTGVNSSNIKAIGYDAATRTLAIQFHGRGAAPGPTWNYHPVTAEGYAVLRDAESVGKYFNDHIKTNQNLTAIKCDE